VPGDLPRDELECALVIQMETLGRGVPRKNSPAPPAAQL
jgi:hypothetical protein